MTIIMEINYTSTSAHTLNGVGENIQTTLMNDKALNYVQIMSTFKLGKTIIRTIFCEYPIKYKILLKY